MTHTGAAKGPSDQKTLNEELIDGLVEVARRNPQHAVELREAVVHGVLHLLGMDHECDEGEMLVLQRELLSW